MLDFGFYCMDCMEGMKLLDDKSIDMILCDLPYGTTRNQWDVVIPFNELWEQYERIIKDNGCIALFSAQQFTTDLINSNRKLFRYDLIWDKVLPTGRNFIGFENDREIYYKGNERLENYKSQITLWDCGMERI